MAIAAAVSGGFSAREAGLDLVLSAVVAVAVGLALGWGANQLMDFLGDATLQIGLSRSGSGGRGRVLRHLGVRSLR